MSIMVVFLRRYMDWVDIWTAIKLERFNVFFSARSTRESPLPGFVRGLNAVFKSFGF